MSTLAVVILAGNEEQNITGAVENAKQCTDHVIVVNSGSTDKTVELAEKAGAAVVFRKWDDDFSAQRNFSLTQTDTDWILYLDADERLTPTAVEGVRKILQNGVMDKQYAIKRKSVAFGKTFNYGVLYPDHVLRMFPRTKVKWVNKVHERPICDLPRENLPGYMEHHTYRDWHAWEQKLCLYTTVWAENAYEHGKRTSLGSIFGHSLGGFFKMFILHRGFLDGWLGTYMCCNHFFYTMLKYLKLYELQKKGNQ